ncbi:MAG: YXWGXW repeat-containing protein [Pseudomonadota bacterium]
MRLSHSLITALLLGTLAVPAYAGVLISADINLGPPEPRYERIPVSRPGYIWSPGYWQWDGRDRDWVEGYWVEERPNYGWVPDRWDHYPNGWRFARGHYYQRPVVVNRYVYRDNDRHDNGNHYGRDRHDHGDRDSRNDGRSNGHGPHGR